MDTCKKDEEGHILPGTVPSDVECGLVLGRRRNADPKETRGAIRDPGRGGTPFAGEPPRTPGSCRSRIEGLSVCHRQTVREKEHAAIELRMMLEGVAGDEKRDLAVNDIVLTREGNIRIVQFNVYVNGTLLNTYLADGVIISTPPESTGYNLSAEVLL